MFRAFPSLTLLALLAGATPGWAAPGILDLIPDDAQAALLFRNIAELKKKGDQLYKDTEIDTGLRPSDAVNWVYENLGIKDGVDENRPAGIVLVDEKHFDDKKSVRLDERFVVLIPFTDRDKMAANFDIKAGELKEGQVGKHWAKDNKNGFVCVRGSHVLLSTKEAAVRSVAKSKPLAAALSPVRVKALENADILLYVSPHGSLSGYWKGLLKNEEHRSEKALQEIDPDVRRQMFDALASLQSLFATVRIEDGVNLRLLTTFPKELPDPARKFLTRLQGGMGASDLVGLPNGDVMAAQGARGDGTQNVFIIKMLLHYLLDGSTLGKNVPFWPDHLDPAQRLTVVGVASELWKQLQGHRAAIYLNADPVKQGLFSIFLGEVKQLARFAGSTALDLSDKPANKDDVLTVKQLLLDLDDNKFLVRQTATTKLEIIGEPVLPYLEQVLSSKPSLELRRRAEAIKARIVTAAEELRKGLFSDVSRRLAPSFAYVAKAETLDHVAVDLLRIKLADKDIPAGKHFREMLGPDWDKVRVAVHGKQVVLLWRSDSKQLSATLQNLKDGRRGLAESKQLAGFFCVSRPACSDVLCCGPMNETAHLVGDFHVGRQRSSLRAADRSGWLAEGPRGSDPVARRGGPHRPRGRPRLYRGGIEDGGGPTQ